jgi:tetratricopeptide (TPR) repeat protein/O-antigen ligase
MSTILSDFLISTTGNLIRWGIIFLLSFATLTFGGMLPWTWVIIILVPLGLILLWLIQAACAGQLEYRPSPVDLPLAIFLCLILLQMVIGYPFRLDQPDLGPRLLQAAGTDPNRLPFLPGTLDYHATRWSLLFFLAYAACFFLVTHTVERREHLTRLLLYIVSLAGAGGLYGLLEYLSGNQGILGWKVAGGGRVRGTFVNPDHFGAFLSMALFAGIGMVLAMGIRHRRRSRRGGLRSRPEGQGGDEGESLPPSGPPQERLFQQVLILFILGLVGTSLVFTMSRGAILSALLAGGMISGILAIHESLGRRRLLAVAALLVVGGFALWIGLGPVMDRFGQVELEWSHRLILYQQALDMVRDFPILGAGFGTFGSVFPRYQRPPLGFDIRYSYAHNDLLQLGAEGGVIALAFLGLGLWGLFREVALVRVLGLARPASLWTVGASADSTSEGVRSSDSTPADPATSGDPADRRANNGRRRDPFNVGIALGGLGAVVAMLIHSLGDFSLRIPANAILLSVLLAATLQAARLRFHSYGCEPLSPVVVVPLRGRRRLLVVVGTVAIIGWLSWVTVTAALAESKVASATEMIEVAGQAEQAKSNRPWVAWTRRTAGAIALLEGAVRLDLANPRAHLGLGRVYEGLALRAWNTGLSADGRLLPDPVQRGEEAQQLLSKALTSFARAAYLAPMDRQVWGEMGWAHGVLAWMLPEERAEAERLASLAAFRRAMGLRPGDPYVFQLQADYAFQWAQNQRGRITAEQLLASATFQAGVQATRRLVELQPAFLPEALNRMLLLTRDFGVIQTILPPQAPDFLFAARLLEDQGLSGPSRQALEMAVSLSLDADRPIFYQYLAEDSIKRRNLPEAVRLLEFVLGLDPQNLDARLMLADALAQQRQDDRALREYQTALEVAKELVSPSSAPPRPVLSTTLVELPPPTRLEIVESALRDRGLLPPAQRRDPLAQASAALAGFHERRGLSNLAIPLWEQAVARAPGEAQIHFGYGESLDSLGAWIPAQSEYRKALELDPRDVSLRLRLADKYMRNGLSDQAMALWQEVTRIRPANVEARIRLAGVYEKLGRRREAELEYDQVLRLDPGNEPARLALPRLRGRAPSLRISPSRTPRPLDEEKQGSG